MDTDNQGQDKITSVVLIQPTDRTQDCTWITLPPPKNHAAKRTQKPHQKTLYVSKRTRVRRPQVQNTSCKR
jgi:hypothetical protein